MLRGFVAFACLQRAWAWTRLAVVESGSCENAGCEVTATCPENTWPVACDSSPRASNSWFKDGHCVASSIFDEWITVKAACTSMFRSFVVTGDGDAKCPEGSSLERCFCQECLGQPATIRNGTCLAPEVGRPQALCLAGDTQWLLQNAAGIGFVEYCGWVPYQRPRNLPAESYRNDSDCRHVMATPLGGAGGAGCSTEECTSLEDCIARCDVCANCSAVLQMASGTSPARCYMQQNIHVDELRAQPFETGFFVNERNGFGCTGRIEDRMARGITGVKIFADLECQKELTPEKLYMMDAVGLTPLDGTWVPKCSQSRCSPGGLSFVATFVKPTVVRCVAVQASDRYALGWRLSKTSAALTGIQSLTETLWQEVARSGKGMGVRASWDGLMEIEADLRSSVGSWDVPGGDIAVLPVVILLLVFFTCLSLIIWMRYFNTQRHAAENLRPVAASMVPPIEVVALTLDEITFQDEARAESTVSYVLPSEVAILQNLLDFTYRSTVTHARRCPQALAAPCPTRVGPGVPVAFHTLNALRFTAGPMAGYVKKRKEIQQRRDALKCLEMSSQLSVAKYPQLKEVLANLEPSSNEAYLWYGTNIRRAFDFLDTAGSEETAKLGLRFTESCTQADELATDEQGHYENVFALLLCRVCLGRFYYATDLNSQTREEVKSGDFDSVLLDRYGDGCRECVVYNPKQVMPEFLILYRRYYEHQDVSVPTDPESFKLEVPIYWQSLSRPLSEPFRSQPHAATTLQRSLQSLVEASSSSRHLISSARQIEDSQLWRRYQRVRRSKRPAAIKGALEAPSLDPWPNELLLWYLCDTQEEATSASEGSFQTSPRQRRAGIHLTESLRPSPGCSSVVLCRVALGDVHYTDSAPDLAAVQSARSVGKDALVAHASRGRKDFVLFREDQLYAQFLLELKNTE